MMTTDQTVSIVLAGVGGQGILLAGEILATAAIKAGFRVKTSETHGMAQRGGSVITHVRYGPAVHSPLVTEGTAGVLAATEQTEALRHARYLAPDGLAVVSSQVILPVSVSTGASEYPADVEQRLRQAFPRLIYFSAAELAIELGNARAANVVILGAVSTGLALPLDAWRQAIVSSVPASHHDLNLRAFETGRSAAATCR